MRAPTPLVIVDGELRHVCRSPASSFEGVRSSIRKWAKVASRPRPDKEPAPHIAPAPVDGPATEIWQFYWIHHIPVAEITTTYGLASRSDAACLAAGPAYFPGLTCIDCGKHLVIKSRADLQSPGLAGRCVECWEAWAGRRWGRR